MKKLIASISIAAALGGGALALNTLLPAGAQSSLSTATSSDPAPGDAGCATRRNLLQDALDGLVKDGTITQAQEDAILQSVKDTAQADGFGHGNGRDGRRARILEGALKVSADKIGVSEPDLITAVRSGQSISQVAEAHGVATQDVIDALVAAGTTKADAAAAAGTITQQQADAIKARLPQAADRIVNHAGPGDGC